MSRLGLAAYRIFVLLLGIWTGSGIHESIANHFAWHADPVAWANQPRVEGVINPWPFSTMLLLVATLGAAIVVWRYRGEGRNQAIAAVAGTALIILATLVWFVPELGLMNGGTLRDAELISHARTWIALNAARLIALIVLLYVGIAALSNVTRRNRP